MSHPRLISILVILGILLGASLEAQARGKGGGGGGGTTKGGGGWGGGGGGGGGGGSGGGESGGGSSGGGESGGGSSGGGSSGGGESGGGSSGGGESGGTAKPSAPTPSGEEAPTGPGTKQKEEKSAAKKKNDLKLAQEAIDAALKGLYDGVAREGVENCEKTADEQSRQGFRDRANRDGAQEKPRGDAGRDAPGPGKS